MGFLLNKKYVNNNKLLKFFFRGNGWAFHIYTEHNVYNYLNFALYLQEKDMRDCNELEKYVKEMLSKRNIQFFPIYRSMALENSLEKSPKSLTRETTQKKKP